MSASSSSFRGEERSPPVASVTRNDTGRAASPRLHRLIQRTAMQSHILIPVLMAIVARTGIDSVMALTIVYGTAEHFIEAATIECFDPANSVEALTELWRKCDAEADAITDAVAKVALVARRHAPRMHEFSRQCLDPTEWTWAQASHQPKQKRHRSHSTSESGGRAQDIADNMLESALQKAFRLAGGCCRGPASTVASEYLAYRE